MTLDMTRAFPVAPKLPEETADQCTERQAYEHVALEPLRQRFAARYQEVLDAEWQRRDLSCMHRSHHDQHCKKRATGLSCREYACPILLAMAEDMESTDRTCYVDRKDRVVYVERFAHAVRPWFIWHEEAPLQWRDRNGSRGQSRSCRQVGAGCKTLAEAQAKLDRLAARYGWQPTSMPDYVQDEVG